MELHESPKRWKVVVAHRRAGKTTACLNHLIRSAENVPSSKYAFIAPTYKQAKNVAWDILKLYARRADPYVKFNEAELRADFSNNSRITLYGSDNPDSLRGIGLHGVVFDEYSQQPSKIFTEIIIPTLADAEGYGIWIGTPQGKNDFWRLYKGIDATGKRRKDYDKWLRMLLTVDDTGLISENELATNKAQQTDDEYLQEWYCSFEAAVKGAYYAEEIAKARTDGRITKVDYENTIGVFTVWDLGISTRASAPAGMSVGFWQKVRQEMRLIDYHETTDKGFDWWSKFLKEKPYTYLKHFAPHDIKVPEMSSGRSRLEIARELGIDFDITPNLPISDGIHAGRLMFSRLWVDERKCQQWLDYIAQYRREWDDDRGMFKDIPRHDFTSHACLAGNTIIKVTHGAEYIKDVNVGDYVITPMGKSKVLKAGKVKVAKELIEVTLKNGSKLIMTPEHKLFTLRGLVQADILCYDDSIINTNYTICEKNKLYSMAKSIGFRDTIIEVGEHQTIMQRIYTEIYGNIIMEISQKIIIFIIKTGIGLITRLKTWNASMAKSICQTMLKRENGMEQKQTKSNLQRQEKKQQNGIKVQQDGNGIQKMQRCVGGQERFLRRFVKYVEKHLTHIGRIQQSIATPIVKLKRLEQDIDVYDLSVEHDHCYYANCHLVSNSDMYRYTAVAEDLMTSQRGAVLTEDTLPDDVTPAVRIKDGMVSQEEMEWNPHRQKDWRFQ